MKAKEREENQRIWEARIIEFEESGKTQEGWCEEQGVTLSSLRYWRRKFTRQQEEDNTPGWLKVDVKEDVMSIREAPKASAGGHDSITIRYADISIHLPLTVKKEAVREVVAALMRS